MIEEMKTDTAPSSKPLRRVLAGERVFPPPVWLMRQAGRYLPEYRELRASARDFLHFCYSPELAAEATLQPIRRYGMDAAILFSDILVIPDALGQAVAFREGEGPVLEPLRGIDDIGRLDLARLPERLEPVYETLRRLRPALPAQTTLIGFAGAPWTLACYMIEGRGGGDFLAARRWAYAAPESFRRLIDLLTEAVIRHLDAQVAAGAEAVQIFDSWAGLLPDTLLSPFSVEPLARIARAIGQRHPGVPVIVFPRGVGVNHGLYRRPEFAGVSLDTSVSAEWAGTILQPYLAVQGNLDPALLVAGGPALANEVRRLKYVLGRGRYIFNLGHGVVPATPPDHVAALVELVRAENQDR